MNRVSGPIAIRTPALGTSPGGAASRPLGAGVAHAVWAYCGPAGAQVTAGHPGVPVADHAALRPLRGTAA